ncbi:hypothetical protein F4813DRAFT_41880 [Daldinia decipiens]|uniref:uncharacterized protein n=1 Tax=Daldinia decipiens TaxID=326647 RepID=UPI0020C41EDE|nr:uncharacterized protein F4813DRAFT_41880 [Daldinia decipiens]KAI1658688.1 hypothetical protein F4813DRAFT_41880 [Daldinia decipiens]
MSYYYDSQHGPGSRDHLIVPETLLGAPPTSQSSGLVVGLTAELLCSIFELLDPLDKVSLACSCKHLLHISHLHTQRQTRTFGSRLLLLLSASSDEEEPLGAYTGQIP